jgi:excisionase family DNA binding protein
MKPLRRLGFTVSEVAAMTGTARWTVYRWIEKGKLRAIKLGGRVLIPAKELRQLFGEEVEEIGARQDCSR